MSDLDVAFSMNTPTGWVDIEDPENGYELHKDAFATRTISHRKSEASNDWTGGSYTSRSVRENVLEQVDFYVGASGIFECHQRLAIVTAALDSLSWQAIYRMGDYQETWSCTVSDYTLESDQALSHSKLILVRAKIPRHPVVVTEQVVTP